MSTPSGQHRTTLTLWQTGLKGLDVPESKAHPVRVTLGNSIYFLVLDLRMNEMGTVNLSCVLIVELIKNRESPGGPVVRTLGLSLPRARVQTLVGEPRSIWPLCEQREE